MRELVESYVNSKIRANKRGRIVAREARQACKHVTIPMLKPAR